MTRKVLILGGTGQVGRALKRLSWPADVGLAVPARADLDLTDAEAVRRRIGQGGYAAVVNAAAYTAVDRAERERDVAFAVNGVAPGVLADAAATADAVLIHLSTDYVFDGRAGRPYDEDDAPAPLNVYGASKLAGERAVLEAQPQATVMRTSWIVGPDGNNFLTTMLRLAGERAAIDVVDDQTGRPTAASEVARAAQTVLLRRLDDPTAPGGLLHFAGAGQATWADLARSVLDASRARGGPHAEVRPIATRAYPTPARRPADTRLATGRITRDYGVRPRPWDETVAEIVAERLKGAGA
ncbi:MAG: dTDP-4-dehydrorhamnose reductase [Brevundimonas sp.]|uniref:dTDP-4-dehydrorhamnose reductase n=1 Tax=Brevundimonas sp. TaxID=1871086 RepID=UPI000DBBE76F|nr:dTDP-4-dehydrorhamnose reductase [Brevundimonas sp.]PZU57741.1 MAG: dTDP-4-dehydrorhamnose reductase [Brevundimonas sp.]